MSKRNKQYDMASPATAVLDPPESGPPEETELGQADGQMEGMQDGQQSYTGDTAGDPGEGQAESAASPAAEKEIAPDCSAICAGLDRQSPPAWPSSSPFQVDWPWREEIDPFPGEESGVVGWNWNKREICVVTAVPPVVNQWPFTLTVEIRPMPTEWRRVKVFNLTKGEQLDVEWYTRWNRAYSQFVLDDAGSPIADESGTEVNRITGSGWLAVVPQVEKAT